MNTKSLIFILLVLAAAVAVWFLVWQTNQEKAFELGGPSSSSKGKAPSIESPLNDFDTELGQEIKSFEDDSLDLTNLETDASLDIIDSDLNNFSL